MTQPMSILRKGKYDLEVALTQHRVAATISHSVRGGPVRAIINGRHRKPTGRYASRKARRSLPWEAKDERAYFWLCESDADVVDYLSQPHRLSIRRPSDGEIVYYPDVRRTLASGRIEIVEVKKDVSRSSRLYDPDYALKLTLARLVYEGLGWSFTVVIGDELRKGYRLRNAETVQRNRFARTASRDVVAVLGLIESAGGVITVDEAVQALGGTALAAAKFRSLVVQRFWLSIFRKHLTATLRSGRLPGLRPAFEMIAREVAPMTRRNFLRLYEEWDFPRGRVTFTKELTNKRLLFVDAATNADFIVAGDQFERLHAEGLARRVRTRSDSTVGRYDDLDDVPPEGATDTELARRFYCRKWDEDPCAKSDVALKLLVARHATEARKRGIAWQPSPGALRRAINTRGEVGRRPTRVMLTQTGKVPRQRWPVAVADIMTRCVFWFYAARTRDKGDAYGRMRKFIATANRFGKVRRGAGWKGLPVPSYETLRLRIDGGASIETWTEKYGAVEARRRFKGTRPGLSAKARLDVVLIDSTVVDGWCVLDDRLGIMIPAGRPTLTVAMDVCTRTVLAVVLTFEPPSLHTIMSCVQLVNVKKVRLIDEHPELAELWAEKWGKPDTIVVDNAWEQVGVSFQDACEDAQINVEWAPVKNPEYKAVIERVFHTLNKKLFHKLVGVVPLPPTMMRKLGLDPRKDATITRSRLELLIHRTLRDSYQFETHAGLGVSPEAAWRAGTAPGRELIDDANFLAAAFGTVRTATLTRSGIRLDNMRFHDPVTTTKLLVDLAKTTPVRVRRVGSATALVKVKFNPADISRIEVWNSKRKPKKGYETLPNVDAKYVQGGLGNWHNAQIRAWAKAQGLPFQTDDEKWAARDRLRVETENAAPDIKYAAMRRQRRMLEPPKPALQGDIVDMREDEPGISSMRDYDIPTVTSTDIAVGDGIPEKGPRRGGKKAARKPARRDPDHSPVATIVHASASQTRDTAVPAPAMVVDDDAIADLLKTFAARTASRS